MAPDPLWGAVVVSGAALDGGGVLAGGVGFACPLLPVVLLGFVPVVPELLGLVPLYGLVLLFGFVVLLGFVVLFGLVLLLGFVVLFGLVLYGFVLLFGLVLVPLLL